MKSTARRVTVDIDPTAALNAAAVLADPPAKASMVDLTDFLNTDAPLVVDVLLEASADANLTGACYFGWDPELDKAVYIGKVHGGADLTVKAGKAIGEPVELVAGIYSHVGIGGATLSAGTLTIRVRALEVAR